MLCAVMFIHVREAASPRSLQNAQVEAVQQSAVKGIIFKDTSYTANFF